MPLKYMGINVSGYCKLFLHGTHIVNTTIAKTRFNNPYQYIQFILGEVFTKIYYQ